MTPKYRFFLLILIILVIWKSFQYSSVFSEKWQAYVETSNIKDYDRSHKIKVTVYYEALCSDSRNFILKQLVPVYNNLKDYIDLDLVPYGKAKTIEQNGEITFQCQHSVTECLANKIHACGIVHIKKQSVKLKYVACMINDNMIPHEIGAKCASELGLNYDPISECANSYKGSLILKDYGVQTSIVRPTISFIPTIEIDRAQNVPLVNILKDFQKELCKLFHTKPKQCL